MQAANDLLDKYKRHPFAQGLVPFQAALRGLSTRWPRIYVEDAGRQRWVVRDKKTKQPAVFSHAAVFSSSDHYDTGNYVPQGEGVPVGVEAKSVQNRANSKCFYTYIFDTFLDISLYESQWLLDDHMRGVAGFNPGNLPRRAYLSGQDVKFRNRFWMQTPMYIRRGPQESRADPPSHLHPWVIRGDQESKVFRANPDRPRVWVNVDDEILPIADRKLSLRRGDIVAISFTVTYHVTSVNWFPQFHPADIVLLKAGEGETTDYSAPSMDLYNRPAPSFDPELQAEGSDDEQYREDDDEEKPVQQVTAMEGIVQDTSAESASGEDSEVHQVSMEVDDGGRGEVVDDVDVPTSNEIEGGDDDYGFTMVEVEDKDGDYDVKDFVDVMAEEEEERVTRAGRARNPRGGRKRSQASIA